MIRILENLLKSATRTGEAHRRIVILVLLLLMAGSDRAAMGRPIDRANLDEVWLRCVPTVDRVEGLPGTMVLVGLQPAESMPPTAAAWRPLPPEVVDQDGRQVRAEVVGLAVSPVERDGWEWRTVSTDHEDLTQVVAWKLAVRTPEAVGRRTLRVGGSTLRVHAIEGGDIAPASRRISAPGSSPRQIRALGDRLRVWTRNPSERWRIRVLEQRFGRVGLWGDHVLAGRFEDPLLEAWSIQQEARIHHVLARITRIDPEIGADVLGTLTAAVRMPEGSLVPVWPIDQMSLEELLSGVLRRPVQDSDAVLREANAFLQRHPGIGVWIVDESGSGSARNGQGGLLDVIVGIAELRGRTTVVSSGPVGVRASSVDTIDGHTSTEQRSLIPVGANEPVGVIRVRGGGTIRDVTFMALAARAQPPGLAIGPLRPEWRQGTFGTEMAVEAAPDRLAMGLLTADAEPDGEGVRAWRLYLECLGNGEPDEYVRIWVGGFGRSEWVLRVTPDGRGFEEISGERVEGLRVSRRDDRWTIHVPLEGEASWQDGMMLLAVERGTASGERWSWPRPMVAGQREPGRMAIDLRSWWTLPSPMR